MDKTLDTIDLTATTRRAPRQTWRIAKRAVTEFFDDGCPQSAAAISYYGLFSLFPLLILLVGVFGLVVQGGHARDAVINFLLDELPLRRGAGREDLRNLLEAATAGAGGFGIIGIVGLAFSASGLMGAVRAALNRAWDLTDTRPIVRGKLVDIALIVVMGVVVAVSLAVSVAARFLASLSGSLEAIGAAGEALRVLLEFGPLTSTVLALVVFLGLFRFVPATDTRVRDVFPGALVAAVGLEAAKLLFGLYLAHAADYNAVYASLGSVIAFMVFVYIGANIALMGAEVAAHWPEIRDGDPRDS